MSRVTLFGAAISTSVLFATAMYSPPRHAPPRVIPNDNRVADGTRRGVTLELALVARLGEWHPNGDDAPGAVVPAFAVEGGAPRIPGPLVRVTAGSAVAVTIRNALPDDTLRVYGLHVRPLASPVDTAPIVLAPGVSHTVRFRLDAPGTFYYWGTTTGRALPFRTGIDAQLTGAIVVDPRGSAPRDRVFVLGIWADTVARANVPRHRVLATVNGRAWPHTERLSYAVGDTVRWRVINASGDLHPMHLHGFYFHVTSRGDGVTDTLFAPGAEPLAVTEPVTFGASFAMTWVPERAGHWLYHCHIPEHFGPRAPLGLPRDTTASHGAHAQHEMSGMVLGVDIRPAPGGDARGVGILVPRAAHRRHLRLLVRANVGSTAIAPLYEYAIQKGTREPNADTGLRAAPPLVLTRGEPVAVTVVNRLPEPTAVHWHGIELESYYDGVPGFSGAGTHVTPLIAPGDSFEVRFTPPRAGTFIYHTHADEERQQAAGLAGPLIVLERGARLAFATDRPIMITSPQDFDEAAGHVLFNAVASPAPIELRAGRTTRLRIVNMTMRRSGIHVALVRDSVPLPWRVVARDGAEIPVARQSSRASREIVSIGQTLDVEITPDAPGALRLVALKGGGPRSPLLGVQPLRVVAEGAGSPRLSPASTRVEANDNRVPMGTLRDGVLRLALVARMAEWHPDAAAAPGAPMMAFAEEGGPARIPGPLVRVPAGTEAAVRVRNALSDTLRVYGLFSRVRPLPDVAPFVLAPGESRDLRLRLDLPGTYLYWGTTMRRPIALRTREDAQLSGAIVVDPAGSRSGARPRDRIFVLGEWSDTVDRAGTHRRRVLAVINGRSWPYTERLSYTVGDTVRWRMINASADLHPMHLHGFYFRVTSRGDGTTDSTYASSTGEPAGDLAVTEPLLSANTVSLEWIPERAGNWLVHCHVPEHFAPRGPLGTAAPAEPRDHDHALGGMSGLVLGVTVKPKPGAATPLRAVAHERHLRLLVRENVGSTAATPFFSYALHERGAEPALDTGLVPAPVLDLARGEPVHITVVNRLREPTAVHWHGIELESSYYDGVPGFSGTARRITPLIAPDDSFEVHFTPPRAGTFIYHTHADEGRQQHAGLAGAIVVREPGTTRDPTTDIPIVLTSPTAFERNRRESLINARLAPPPIAMVVGRTYRLRFVQMSANRAASTVEVRRGDSLFVWRPVAKDGADLPPRARTLQPARTFTTIGETGDFEITPTEPGDLRLEVRYGGPLGPSPGGLPRIGPVTPGSIVVAATLPIRVTVP